MNQLKILEEIWGNTVEDSIKRMEQIFQKHGYTYTYKIFSVGKSREFERVISGEYFIFFKEKPATIVLYERGDIVKNRVNFLGRFSHEKLVKFHIAGNIISEISLLEREAKNFYFTKWKTRIKGVNDEIKDTKNVWKLKKNITTNLCYAAS